jgi:hypothetical protein
MLVRIVGPDFVAGLIIKDDKCVRAAPVLRRFIGKSADDVRAHCRQRGWHASVVDRAASEREQGAPC